MVLEVLGDLAVLVVHVDPVDQEVLVGLLVSLVHLGNLVVY